MQLPLLYVLCTKQASSGGGWVFQRQLNLRMCLSMKLSSGMQVSNAGFFSVRQEPSKLYCLLKKRRMTVLSMLYY